MSFGWEFYFDLAGELAKIQPSNPGLSEACYRSSISRSYYAVFNLAKKWLILRGEIIPAEKTHQYVRDQFRESCRRVEKKIGDDLRRLWSERKDADYEEDVTVDKNRADTAYELSKRLLPLIQKGLSDQIAAKKTQP